MAHYTHIEDLLAEDSFVRWITGKASEKEHDYWARWMAEDPVREIMVREARELHQSLYYERFDNPDIESELSELERAISQHEGSVEEIVPFLRARRNQMYYWVRIAAIFLLIIMTGWGIYIGFPQPVSEEESRIEWVQSTTGYGEKRELHLSDGSKIVINADSRLKYPTRHTGDTLEVWLEGEAYFKITRKPGADQRLFVVHTKDGDVRVLGTQFNVNTRKEQTEVVLEKGKVRIEKPDTSRSQSVSRDIKPGELARFNRQQKRINVQSVNAALYTSWTQNRLLFEETSLLNIAKHIETIYGLEVCITSPELKHMLVSGAVSNDNLPVLLASLSRLLEVDIDRKEKLIVITD